MTDITPQTVFGFDEQKLRQLIREECTARNERPSRIRLAAGYIADRLKEPTSYAGLAIIAVPLLARYGITLSDDGWGEIVQIAVAAAGLAAFMLKERGAAAST